MLFFECRFIDGSVIYSHVLHIRHFHIIMFVHNKMSLVRFDFQKRDDTSTLNIEGIDVFLDLTKVATSCDLLVATRMTLLRVIGGNKMFVIHAITFW